MIERTKRIKFVRNLLILAALVSVVLLSWLAGHTLRYSFPALWHPPIRDTDPQIKYGLEADLGGIRRGVVLPGLAPAAASPPMQPTADSECTGFTYFTSLPPKCLTADGRLVVAQDFKPHIISIP